MRAVFGGISLAWLASTGPLSGQGELERESLEDLGRIHVVVGGLDAQRGAGGLDRSALEGFLVFELREAGVPVVSRNVEQVSRREPYLHLHVDVLSQGPRDFVYSLKLRLYQRTCITDFPSHGSDLAKLGGCMATPTWEWYTLGVTRSWLRRVVREELSTLTDRFAADYLAANP